MGEDWTFKLAEDWTLMHGLIGLILFFANAAISCLLYFLTAVVLCSPLIFRDWLRRRKLDKAIRKEWRQLLTEHGTEEQKKKGWNMF